MAALNLASPHSVRVVEILEDAETVTEDRRRRLAINLASALMATSDEGLPFSELDVIWGRIARCTVFPSSGPSRLF